jgi:pyruvate/2-oxoacid:ferredoxin oxidoreductase beta subunit
MNDEEFKVVENMERYGGSFVQALAQCFYRADNNNFIRLRLAFPEYWEEYSVDKDAKELQESDDYDLKTYNKV